MRILVLGGTAWLGGEIVTAALASGHEVTCLARGESGRVPTGARFISADRDQPDAYAGVVPPTSEPRPNLANASSSGSPSASDPSTSEFPPSEFSAPESSAPAPSAERWDAVIDLSRSLEQVRAAVVALEPHADAYLFVSSTSAYASQSERNADENAATFPDPDPATPAADVPYGVAKAAAERAVRAAFGPDRSTLIRPGLIGGPGDPTGRSTYWPTRFARAAEGTSTTTLVAHPSDNERMPPTGAQRPVLAPAVPDLPTALIDVRDLAQFIVRVVERGIRGVFNATSPGLPFSEHLAVARQVADYTGPVVEVDERWLLDHGVSPWAGPRSLPLWIDDRDWWGMNDRDVSRALEAGMQLRPLADTLTDILSAEKAASSPPAASSAVTGEESDKDADTNTDKDTDTDTDTAARNNPRAGLLDADEAQLLTAWGSR
ncbi:NAD-dependent epimerase/dehydratase family protein [Leifsonia sp. ALI-44-B]|uniref:NAD-dependent epimerase/dehydratase family protein n=1 Tax=Leifsonia sp. ALI-44-B TaxID=1933776 RepID=UPI00117B7469|nr:NAD-dependent epimerase/dehydratase family protein [Leifsonia sp. ALI-44-B]